MMKIDKIAFWVVMVLLAALFGMGGGFKIVSIFTGLPEEMKGTNYPAWFMHLLGFGELASAISLFLPKFRPYGLLLMTCIMCGVLATHITHGDSNEVFPMLGILAMPVLGIWLNKRVNGATVSF